jgi:hypothetical protein
MASDGDPKAIQLDRGKFGTRPPVRRAQQTVPLTAPLITNAVAYE